MRSLLAAEWQKWIGHRWLTGFTVWIFPMGAIGIFATFILLLLLLPDSSERLVNAPLVWTEQFLGPWVMFADAFGGLMARVLPITFFAGVFAGEFNWGTWKNIVPRGKRLHFIVAKYLVAVLMVMLALVLTSLLAGFGTFLLGAVTGQSLIPELTGEVLADFVGDYVTAVGLGLVVVILLANYAAISALITRSMLGSAILAMGIMIFEEFLLPLLNLISRLLNVPDVVQLYRFTPTYNLKNASYWIQVGEPSNNQFFIDLAQPDTLLFSVVILLAWTVGALLVVGWLFKRQDITT